MKRTVMSFDCSNWAAEFGVSNLFLLSRFGAFRDEDRLRATEKVLISLSSKMKAIIMNSDLLKIVGDCEVDPVSLLLAFARENEIDWTD